MQYYFLVLKVQDKAFLKKMLCLKQGSKIEDTVLHRKHIEPKGFPVINLESYFPTHYHPPSPSPPPHSSLYYLNIELVKKPPPQAKFRVQLHLAAMVLTSW